jgi:type III pantothenate kinase
VKRAGSLLLTADLGNSRCKLRLWELAGAQARAMDGATFASEGEAASAIPAWLEARAPLRHAALCSVAAPELEARLRAWLERATEGEVLTPHHGLVLDVREAHTVGADRLFAARGALRELAAPALVLDAGTALTVDALDVREGKGIFLGGAIAPGPQLLADALARSTARLPRSAPRPGAPALGKSTREAIESGVALGFRGAARELAQQVGRESGLTRAAIVLTGGARDFLLEPPLFEGREVVAIEDLVHLGLLAALADSLGARQQSARDSG